MAHDHGHHHHGNARRTLWAALLTGGFMIAEAVGGVISGSLALLADAGHMLTDSVALFMAWFAFRLSRRPADWQRTYGFERMQVLAAFANGLTLLFIVGWIAVEALGRLYDPVPVLGGTMLAVALLGLIVNIAAFALLHGGDRDNLNIRGALLHVAGDLLGSVAALIAAGIIVLTGWTPIDPILSLVVALLILRSAWMLVRESGHILLEGAPKNLAVHEIGPDLTAHVEHVQEVHHVHVWGLTPTTPLVTLHARAPHGTCPDRTVTAIKARLKERFAINHSTVQIEHGACVDRPNSLSG